MTLKQEIQTLLKEHDLSPQKFRGQNFLVDREIIRAIVESADLKPNETVLEIGAGVGNLTQALLAAGEKVIAVEKDGGLARVLKKTLGPNKNLTVVTGDILKFDETKIARPYKVVGNIPYYITGAIVRKFLESKHRPELIILMIQKEVGERMVARPPRAAFLSMMLSVLASVAIKKKVPAGAFWPRPKVDSTTVVIKPKGPPTAVDIRLIELIRLSFRQPRKLLLNNLSQGLAVDKVALVKTLARTGLRPNTRAHELTLEQWKKLYYAVKDNIQKH